MGNFIPVDRDAAFKPRIVSSNPAHERQEIAESVLPKGATTVPRPRRTASGGYFGGGMPMGASPVGMGGGGSATYHMQRPYFPGTESPDRVQYPKTRQEANKAWRLFHETDPIFGTAVDMYAEMLVSDFDIMVGDEKSREIRDTLEYMCQVTNLQERLRYIIKEYLVMGEAIPHCFYDDSLGIWTYVAMHNPDYIDVVDAPIVNMDPILNFIPDDGLRDLMLDNSPEARDLRDRLPAEFVTKIMARQKIRLSPLNSTFIARRLHPYQVRGTSMASRMWRIFMVEDAVYNSTIATFRRHACFVAGTGVLTSEGVKNVEDMKEGDLVVSGEGYFKKVEAAWQEEAEEIVELETMGSELLECTVNHRFKVWTRPRKCACGCGSELVINSNGQPRFFADGHHLKYLRDPVSGRMPAGASLQWKDLSFQPKIRVLADYEPIQTLPAADIKVGDYLMIPRKFEELDIELTPGNLDKARLLGYYAAKGCARSLVRKGENLEGIVFTFGLDEFDTWARDLEGIGTRIGARITRHREFRPEDPIREGKTSVYIQTVADLPLVEWVFHHVGRYSSSKHLSDEVMRWPLELKRELLKGMYCGDGHVTKNGESVYYTTVSRSLAYQVRIILAQLGILGSICVQQKPQENWSDVYQVITCGYGNQLLREIVDKNEGWVTYKKVYSHSWTWMDSDFLYVPVRKVSIRQEKTPVYNLSVEGDHSYIANGLATLNSPVKVVKLGDAASGWLPAPGAETKVLQMLNRVETDPQAWLVYNYGINFEAWGTTDRAISISKEHDVIEKVKLLALGLSKSFMTGEVTYASAKSGLQVFLRRLLSLRQFLENIWLYPKFFRPISEINEWATASPSEVNHKYRIKRTAQEIQEQNLVMMPTLKWKNKLDPSVDQDLLQAYGMLEKLGVKLSKATISSAVGLDWQDELEASLKEFKSETEMKDRVLGDNLKKKYEQAHGQAQQQGAQPPGAPGSGAKPPGAPGGGGGKPGASPGGGGGGGMNDASKPPGSAPSGGGGDIGGIEAPSGGGLPTGVE